MVGRDGSPLHLQGLPAAFNTTFAPESHAVVDYRSYLRTDLARQREFLRQLQDRGVRVTSRGTWFLSAAHTDADIDETLAAAEAALRELG